MGEVEKAQRNGDFLSLGAYLPVGEEAPYIGVLPNLPVGVRFHSPEVPDEIRTKKSNKKNATRLTRRFARKFRPTKSCITTHTKTAITFAYELRFR